MINYKEYPASEEVSQDPNCEDREKTNSDISSKRFNSVMRRTQVMPVLRSHYISNKTGEHPPVRSTGTDSKPLRPIIKNEDPQQEAAGETGAPHYGKDDDEQVVGGV